MRQQKNLRVNGKFKGKRRGGREKKNVNELTKQHGKKEGKQYD